MRTLRIKLYQFKELTPQSKEIAVYNEAKRFHINIAGFDKSIFALHELDAAKERILKNKYEFRNDGELYPR